jgi:hypothetical protein
MTIDSFIQYVLYIGNFDKDTHRARREEGVFEGYRS